MSAGVPFRGAAVWLRIAVFAVVLNLVGLGEEAYAYALTADTDVNARTVGVTDISLKGVKPGDDMSAVAELLLGTKTEEPKVEIGGTLRGQPACRDSCHLMDSAAARELHG